jgi:hypothetical protein
MPKRTRKNRTTGGGSPHKKGIEGAIIKLKVFFVSTVM